MPTTPLHCVNKQQQQKPNHSHHDSNNTHQNNTHQKTSLDTTQQQHVTTANFRNQFTKLMNNQSSTQMKSYWEGPPAHFMLPTHAIHCRLSRSVERCPRACKGKTHQIIKKYKITKNCHVLVIIINKYGIDWLSS